MLVVAFLQWWYGPGWRDASSRLVARLRLTYLNFSIPILITTMFAPWRRIVSAPGGPLEQKARAFVDNLLSRVVGLTVRLITLLTACLLLLGYAIGGGLFLLLWPLLPLLGPALIVGGLI
jgi:hypothetical protein